MFVLFALVARATIVVKKFVAKINACASNTLTNRGYLIGEINIQRVDSNGPSSRRGNNVVVREKGARRSLRVRRQEIAGPSSERRGSAREGARKRSTPGPVVVLSAGGGGGGGGGGGCRRRDLERRGGGGRGAPCLATISSSVAGSAGGCGPVVGLPSYKKRQGSGAAWGRGSRGRGRGRGGGASLLGSGVAPANYNSGLQGVAPELREVVNILGERNQVGTLTGVGPPPGALDSDGQGDEEEGTSTKRPPRPLYRRLINYVRQAWTGVKFALDSEYEEEQTPRYRPDSLASLCRATRFTEAELKRIYRGFKAECPTGVVREETFKCIYSQFFPQGANTSQYAHYVFNTLDQDHSGILSFEDFVTGLSILSRGSIDEKLRWTFSLYDINGDGCITREEMTDIVTAVYELMGKFADPNLDHEGVREKVDRMFQKMDGNKDGVVTLSEFLEACRADPDISTSMAALDTAF
ncbi:hypothetical protein HZU73_09301 [Apis mellifera caucasica]|uniref:Uncharacterized protein LOC100577959 n=1 Tax=Apis mellifera TaxID=7460 RepID=A0A7M7MWD7_APIME|nr:uncharacterized protein LOC100577959 [Apis mellifera]KAG6795518.1 hypothetical protein HZU73_09301 [Apis mellifera caucasica]|eukprot:XP_026302114.1 uncharacterized protein LOC100577959 [Apis mellifera]